MASHGRRDVFAFAICRTPGSFATFASFARRKMKIETILTPAELPAPAQRDLRATACVVFDVPAKLK